MIAAALNDFKINCEIYILEMVSINGYFLSTVVRHSLIQGCVKRQKDNVKFKSFLSFQRTQLEQSDYN